MAQESLKVKIGADVAEGVAGVKQFGNEVNKLSLTVETLQAKIRARKDFILTERDLNKIAQYNKEISSLESVLNQIKNTGKEGFWGGGPLQDLKSNTAAAASKISLLQNAFSSIIAPVSKAYSGIRLIANILPGVGIAGVIAFAAGPIISFVESIFSANKAVSGLSKGMKVFKDELAATAAEAGAGSVANITKLHAALTDLAFPLNQRKKALEEYNKVADKQNQLSEADLTNIGKINGAIEKQIELFKTRAIVRAAEGKLTDLYKVIFENEFKISNAADKFNNKLKEQVQGLDALTNQRGNVKAFTEQVMNLNAAGKQIGVNQTLFSERAISKANERVRELFGFIQRTIEKGVDFGNIFEGVKAPAAKKKIEDDLKARPFLLPVEPVLGSTPKINAEVGKNFSKNPVLLPVTPDLKKDALLLSIGKNVATIREMGARFGDVMGNSLGEVFRTKVDAAISSGMSVEKIEAFQQALRDTIQVGVILADVLGNAFGAFGQALVMGQNALQAFFNSVKSALSQLIGQLLKTIATAAILSLITGGASGGGLSFIGAFKSLLSVKPFAKGGLVSGPTMGLVGEGRTTSRANPEVIAPLDKLKKFIGGRETFPAYLPVHEVSGDTLRLWYKRASDSGRMFG